MVNGISLNRREFLFAGIAGSAMMSGAISSVAQTPFGSNRPAVAERSFRSAAVEAKIDEVGASIADPELRWLFQNCFPNTLDTTVEIGTRDGKPDSFVITGDIKALWLRDSTAQVTPYLPLVGKDPALKGLIRGLIHRQAHCINLEPFANAFLKDPNEKGWDDLPPNKPGVHERKWEIDSLCYAIRLSHQYWKATGDSSPFDDEWRRAMKLIVATFRTEQQKNGPSPYRFNRRTTVMIDAPPFDGTGHPVRPNGLIASAFRPSDDSTIFPFLIPSNAFAVVELRHLAEMARAVLRDERFGAECAALANEVETAIMKHAIVRHPEFGDIFAFEIDGFGGRVLMDDANVPNLLSLPYLGFVRRDNPVYRSTRRFVLSPQNPYFRTGKFAAGVGSPHTGKERIWHLSLIMRALTSDSDAEIAECLTFIKRTHAGTGFMHEAFDPNDPGEFSRKWFAWANTIFGELIVKIHSERRELLKRTF